MATTVAIAGVSVASGGTAVPVIIAIGYALVGWAIFNAVGDLIDTFLLVYNATDERDLDRAGPNWPAPQQNLPSVCSSPCSPAGPDASASAAKAG
ncbi:hypothetical protein [Aestuariispira ectoiniformans]|uniref:hypothetical protein n=1 Tax=Aestuariispira ectoiniformans TaxID=2775080 RepID=UPI00223AD9EC|nr:hypothetical protein [Aestuariispira ectoiniformans]